MVEHSPKILAHEEKVTNQKMKTDPHRLGLVILCTTSSDVLLL